MTSDEFRDLVRNVAGTSAKRIASELRLHGYITRSVIVTAKARLREAQSRRRARLKERSDAHSAH
jgi:ribosomal protein S17E